MLKDGDVAARLLAWYDRGRRALPWRSPPGEAADPYHVWLSEIMLQQTTVATVQGYYHKFVGLWPTVEALASADLEDILKAWAGLGYYARARNLHRCARLVASAYAGRFPDQEDELRRLPGIGAYTAAAIAAIAWNRRAVVVDGNVERVMARLFACTAVLPGERRVLHGLAEACTPARRCGDYAQAVMDLGATVCTPRSPRCVCCPLLDVCQGRLQAGTLPRKTPKKARPVRYGVAFWLRNQAGEVLLRRRPEKGLLGGMTDLPGTPWREGQSPDEQEIQRALPVTTPVLSLLPGHVVHVFTHFELRLQVAMGVADWPDAHSLPKPCFPVALAELFEQALPTVTRKVVDKVMRHHEAGCAPDAASGCVQARAARRCEDK